MMEDERQLPKLDNSCQHSELAVAIKSGDTAQVQRVLQRGVPTRPVLDYAFYLAAHLGNAKCLETLLNSLPRAFLASEEHSYLYDAAAQGHTGLVRLILDQDIDVNHVCNSNKRSALHIAASKGNVCVCHALLDAGANINLGDSLWNTPLMLAASLNQLESIRLLIRRGSLVNIKNKYGESALYKAVEKSHVQAAELLLALGADCSPQKQGSFGNTLLHVAAKRNNPYMMECLLTYNSTGVDVCNLLGQSPFHIALDSGCEDCVELLLEHGADPNRSGQDGLTPLMKAASRGMPNLVKSLISHGAEINVKKSWRMYERSALHEAVSSGSLDTVRALLQAGAETNSPCKGNITALHLAASQKPTEATLDIILELFRYGSDVNAENMLGHDASRLSLTDFYLPITKVLYDAGAKPSHFKFQISDYSENADSIIAFLCDTEFRHVSMYDPKILRETLEYLKYATNNPRTLQNSCCIYIRHVLGKNIPLKVQQLPLPNKLKDKINFKDVEHMRHLFGSI